MEPRSETRNGRTYTFRQYEPGDAEDFLDLFELVWGKRHSREWFRWRFEANPYVDHVPMFVAEADGAVVGTRPFLAFRMAVGDETVVGLLTVDTMVHPEHRRRGLFTAMTEQSLDYYAERDVAFVFNQPNSDSRPGFRSLGFREIDIKRTYFRVQRPSVFLDSRGLSAGSALARLADGLASGYHRLRNGRRWRTDDVVVRRHPGVATDELTALYSRAVPHGITVHRDDQFYDWRYAGPAWSRRTYVASRGGEAIVALLARTRTTTEGITVTQIADIVPLIGGADWKRGLAGCVEGVLADAADDDVVSAPARVFPSDLATAYGFLVNDELPLAPFVSTDAVLCVRSLRDGGETWEVNGVSLTEPANWFLTFGGRDTT